MKRAEILKRNQAAWNHQVHKGNRWTVPVSPEAIEDARKGQPSIVLTPCKTVPQDWFPDLVGCRTLMLASGGGQQSPIMAAAGAEVTVLDLSDEQLAQDRFVAEREILQLRTVAGSMDDLSMFHDHSFDLIVHPCSNSFVPDLEPVWKEAARVLRPGGAMMAGFCAPHMFLFDEEEAEQGRLKVAYPLPYSDQDALSDEKLASLQKAKEPLMFGHTLADQIGKQLAAGFSLVAMYEDRWGAEGECGWARLDPYIASFIATKSIRG